MYKNEVFAEIVYVLLKVYEIKREQIFEYIANILKSERIHTESNEVILLALETFRDKNLDFVDCLLYAYNKIFGYKVFTLDKKLRKLMN